MPHGVQDTGRRATIRLLEAVGQLPCTMAQLVFVSGLRDLNSGMYRAPTSSEDEATEIDRVLRTMHEQVFCRWLKYRLQERKADLELYFSGLDCDAETRQFLSDLELLLYFMAHGDPGFANSAAQRAPDGPLLTQGASAQSEQRPAVLDGCARIFTHAAKDGVATRPRRAVADRPDDFLQRQAPACALRCSRNGTSDLSPREQEVLTLVGQGKLSKESRR